MRTLAFDGRMGASGDMVCAALVAAGAEPSVLEPVEEILDAHYRIGTTEKNGIAATTVDVLLDSEDRNQDEHGHDHSHDGHDHSHEEHSHEHSHGDHAHGDHDHAHGDHDHTHGDHSHDGHTHAEGAGPSRSYAEVVELVESMGLPAGVEADAKAIFEVLGRAEAAVHGTDLDETHFHEVGADDAIADVVGAALLLADLDVERVVTTPVATGGGEVGMSHGVYPIPAPAVVEVAERASWALRGGPVEAELLTPTGAAILAHFAEGVERLPTLDVDGVGYGAGDTNFPEHPNVLRALVGEEQGSLVPDEIRVLETTLDDATPELLGGLHERLKAAGARDVSVFPTTMKKSRPGHLVQVIVKPEDVERVARKLAVETGTLGVRETGARHRWIAERAFETVEIEIDGTAHEVTVKIASDTEGSVYDVSAEYDDAAAVAAETGLPIREIMRRAENVVRE
ncbi:nickel pincer cofactor biosynthesis protein LarC [Halococcus sp. IIIV-5B]|uniref:nickel pincer cofactor biosynthesis protein LarC n=1 Tax=Halococcus sp. IIIV-5B TaxID=2321230 RepID=UPI000E72FBB8|nr:nickel pincer cofactor biosynthesis protein LarC [Halococcus sp. IIIV-5B]RJT06729.1 nickel pincer cofactor biosynthesis protein LarC [Halococcus sp. IIIV-5B]